MRARPFKQVNRTLSGVLRRRWVAVVVGAALAFSLQHAASAARYATVVHPNFPPLAAGLAMPLAPLAVDRSAILEGEPVFRSRAFYEAPDKTLQAGVFECQGPGKFRWHYDLDETIYVLEGTVHIEYAGATHTLRPGDSAYFKAGTDAVWTVPDRVRKSFVLHEPGRINRWLRRVL